MYKVILYGTLALLRSEHASIVKILSTQICEHLQKFSHVFCHVIMHDYQNHL